MSRIIVINECNDCPYNTGFACAYRLDIIPPTTGIPDTCPLSSLPERARDREPLEYLTPDGPEIESADQYWIGYTNGWNAAIDTITGGADDT